MSAILQYDPQYRRQLNRFVYQLQNWHSKKHLKRKWVLPGENDLVPVYGLQQEGPAAYLHQPVHIASGVSARVTMEKGAQVPPGWVDRHLVIYIEAGWGSIDVGAEGPTIFHAPALLVVEKADLFSLVAASDIEGIITAKEGEQVDEKPTEEMVQEAARHYDLVREALAA